jgi:acetylornithine deacetylase/succinyl-diaminopimelate desuccinylase-like protein
LETTGFTLTRTEADGHPFLIARRIEDPELPTMLSYSHGDTVPGMEGRWRAGRDPWTLTEATDEGRLYGRGIADNKGQFWVNFSAMRSVLETRGALGFNVVWLIEMGEEIGSPGLGAVIEANRDLLAADLLLASDGPRLSAETPTIFLGARGGGRSGCISSGATAGGIPAISEGSCAIRGWNGPCAHDDFQRRGRRAGPRLDAAGR